MINAGELDKRITIQMQSITRATDGAETITYTDLATVWAAYLNKSGREFYSAQKINSEVTALFKIRWRTGLSNKFRIKYGAAYFNILHIDDTKQREGEMLLLCKEVT